MPTEMIVAWDGIAVWSMLGLLKVKGQVYYLGFGQVPVWRHLNLLLKPCESDSTAHSVLSMATCPCNASHPGQAIWELKSISPCNCQSELNLGISNGLMAEGKRCTQILSAPYGFRTGMKNSFEKWK